MIQGYNQEEYTHLGVAVAQALDLDFIPFSRTLRFGRSEKNADNELLASLFGHLVEDMGLPL